MEPPSTLSLMPDEEVTIPLTGRGSAGYRWRTRVSSGGDVVDASVRSGPAVPPGRGSTPRSFSHDELLAVRGRSVGMATVHLELVRSFEPDKPPRVSYDIEVTVKAT